MSAIAPPASGVVVDEVAPSPTPKKPRRGIGRWVLNIWALIALVYLFTPILFIVLFSFNKPNGNFNIEWQTFTFDNWLHPFAQEALTDSLWVSLKIALVSTIISTIFGSLIAIALTRYKFGGNGVIDLILVLPLTTPEIVLGASLATLFINQDARTGFWTIVIAHIMFQISFVALTVRARLRGFDWTLEHAAQDLGATPWRTFTKVTFPLMLPGILAAALLAFALSLDDFIITFFNAGSTLTFPLQIYGASRVELPPQINVLATIILLVSVALLAIGSVRTIRKTAARG